MYLLISKQILTDHPKLVATYIEDYALGSVSQQISTGKLPRMSAGVFQSAYFTFTSHSLKKHLLNACCTA